jgi:hypothetical protein
LKIPLREDKKPARHEKENRYDKNGSRLNELVRVSKTVSQPNEHCDVDKVSDALDAKITSDGARCAALVLEGPPAVPPEANRDPDAVQNTCRDLWRGAKICNDQVDQIASRVAGNPDNAKPKQLAAKLVCRHASEDVIQKNGPSNQTPPVVAQTNIHSVRQSRAYRLSTARP